MQPMENSKPIKGQGIPKSPTPLKAVRFLAKPRQNLGNETLTYVYFGNDEGS